MELREMRAFVAVVEEGGMSSAARRIHLSQPALSQAVAALEREFGEPLLIRGSGGVSTTEAGAVLLAEVRAVLARHERALAVMARRGAERDGVLRLGVPLELPPALLPRALAGLAPGTRVVPVHLATAGQLAALRAGELDVALVRERPADEGLDAVLVVAEPAGVLLAARVADEVAGPHGVRLADLRGLDFVAFPRASSPAWYDELTGILRSHGLTIGGPVPDGQETIPAVKLAAVSDGHAFALAAAGAYDPLPATIVWRPLAGNPIVRRTWAVWPADSRRRDLAQLIANLEAPAGD